MPQFLILQGRHAERVLLIIPFADVVYVANLRHIKDWRLAGHIHDGNRLSALRGLRRPLSPPRPRKQRNQHHEHNHRQRKEHHQPILLNKKTQLPRHVHRCFHTGFSARRGRGRVRLLGGYRRACRRLCGTGGL